VDAKRLGLPVGLSAKHKVAEYNTTPPTKCDFSNISRADKSDKIDFLPFPFAPPYPCTALQDVWFTSQDGTKLHAWLLIPKGWSSEMAASSPVLLFFQENAGNMSHRLFFFRELARMLQVVIFAPRQVCVWDCVPFCLCVTGGD
jgi:hypothetical protein